MTEEQREAAAAFSTNDACLEVKGMWLVLAKRFASIVDNSNDWVHDPSSAAEAMAWALQAEACFWRATGDAEVADVSFAVKGIHSTASAAPEGEQAQ